MNKTIDFLISPVGQMLRIVIGIVIIWWGFWGDAGWIVGILGFIPFIAGIGNYCLIAPLFGRTIRGKLKVVKAT